MCPNLFEFLLDLFSLILGTPSLIGFGSIVDQIFGFFQSQVRHFADCLDHVDLLVADLFQDHIEFGFFLFCLELLLATAAPAAMGPCGSSADTISFLEFLDVIRQFQEPSGCPDVQRIVLWSVCSLWSPFFLFL